MTQHTTRAGEGSPASRSVTVSLCCNDPDSGNFMGRVSNIEVGGAIELGCKRWGILSFNGCPKLREINGAIVLSGKAWPVRRMREWDGNMCWNGYDMSMALAADFLTWVHRRGMFQCEGGVCTLCDAWEAGSVTAADLLVAITPEPLPTTNSAAPAAREMTP